MDTPITYKPSAPLRTTTTQRDSPAQSAGMQSPATQSAVTTWGFRLLTFGILAIAVIGAHGWSLSDGLSLDDHWHYRTIRESGWSIPELLDATTIRSEDLYELWWQDHPVQFQYSRPLSVALMKTVYTLTDGSAVAQHSVNHILHLIAACMVTAICFKLTANRFWSLVGGVLFVVYPLSINAVGWLAAQNMVLQTALLLAAMLAYIRASNLNLNISAPTASVALNAFDYRWFALTVALWVGALFSRENAIVLPGILVAMDLAFCGWRLLWQRKVPYLILAGVGIAFLIWRLGFFYEPMPDVYVRRSGEPGFLLWCVAKLGHYLCGALWMAPMTVGPTGRIAPFSDVPFDMLLTFASVAVITTIYFALARKARGQWVWPLWIVLTMAPVIPVLATPHSGYICGVATSIALTLGPPSAKHHKLKYAYRISTTLIFLALLSSIGMLKVNRLMWKGLLFGESYVATGLRAQPLPPETTDVFLINLPFAAVYAKEHLVDANPIAHEALKCHVLTFAPDLPRMDQPSTITQLDNHRFKLSVEAQPYFSRLLGRFLIDGFRKGGQLKQGERFTSEVFDVEILNADETGVFELLFTFKKPLTSPQYTFFVSSDECGAMPFNFRESAPPIPALPSIPETLESVNQAAIDLRNAAHAAADTIFAGLQSPRTAIQIAAENQLRNSVQPLAIATASPTMHAFDDDEITPEEADRLRKWWHATVTADTINHVFAKRNELLDIRHRRDELRRGRALIGRFIKSDLYLTGKPFPGPRTTSN